MKIVMNGGHCPGKDPGAVGAQTTEAAVCRQVMEQAALLLRDQGHETLTVQTNELADIVGASDGYGADLFVAVHCNAAGNQAARGSEVYFASAAGSYLAACICSRLTRELKTNDRGVRDGSRLYVLRHTAAVAVLVELAFISNPVDEALLLGRTDAFASAVVGGIMDFLNGKEAEEWMKC